MAKGLKEAVDLTTKFCQHDLVTNEYDWYPRGYCLMNPM